jgi:hypothetical protein
MPDLLKAMAARRIEPVYASRVDRPAGFVGKWIPREVEPGLTGDLNRLCAGEGPLGEGWTLRITTKYPEEDSYWAHVYDEEGAGVSAQYDSHESAAHAVLDVLLHASEIEYCFPAEVAANLANVASTAAREIALSLAAPTTLPKEALHAA